LLKRLKDGLLDERSYWFCEFEGVGMLFSNLLGLLSPSPMIEKAAADIVILEVKGLRYTDDC
jgi:hypothetical protein